MAFLRFDIGLEWTDHSIPPLSDHIYNYFTKIKDGKRIGVSAKLISILRTRPDSDVLFFATTDFVMGTWTKKQTSSRETVDKWGKYSHLRHDLVHDTASAIIAAHMISSFRHKIDKVFTNYSAQYLLDVVPDPIKEKSAKRRCMSPPTPSVVEYLRYALEHGIPKEKDWEYIGYADKGNTQKNVTYYEVKADIVEPKSLTEALMYMKYAIMAAKLHIFEPELGDAKDAEDKIYRGLGSRESEYHGLEDVMIYGTKVMNGELVALVKFPCNKVKFVNVSLDVMIVEAPEKADLGMEDLKEPTCLLTEFCVLEPV